MQMLIKEEDFKQAYNKFNKKLYVFAIDLVYNVKKVNCSMRRSHLIMLFSNEQDCLKWCSKNLKSNCDVQYKITKFFVVIGKTIKYTTIEDVNQYIEKNRVIERQIDKIFIDIC